MSLDFTTVGAQLAYWLTNITAPFSGYSGSQGQPLGERGIDIGLPYHTPVYAIVSGPVLGTGYYGGGGVVSQQASSSDSLYYQHLSDITVASGDNVQVGQLIGYSGGQIGYGDHPATSAYSSGPHIEVGVNGPWGGMWHPLGPNVNPLPVLHAIAATPAVTTAPTGGSGTQISDFSSPSKTGGEAVTLGNTPQCQQPSGFSLLDPGAWTAYVACLTSTGQVVPAWLQPIQSLIKGIDAIIADPGRIVKAIAGAFFLLAGVVILILPDAAGVATAALGAPEAAPGVRAFLKRPGSVNPTRVTSNAIIERQREKQGARRQVRYVRQAQVAEYQAEQRRAAPGTKPLRRALPTQPLQETTSKPEPVKETNPFKAGTIGMTPKNPPMPEKQPVSPSTISKTQKFSLPPSPPPPPPPRKSIFRTAKVERGGQARELVYTQEQVDAMMAKARKDQQRASTRRVSRAQQDMLAAMSQTELATLKRRIDDLQGNKYNPGAVERKGSREAAKETRAQFTKEPPPVKPLDELLKDIDQSFGEES